MSGTQEHQGLLDHHILIYDLSLPTRYFIHDDDHHHEDQSLKGLRILKYVFEYVILWVKVLFTSHVSMSESVLVTEPIIIPSLTERNLNTVLL